MIAANFEEIYDQKILVTSRDFFPGNVIPLKCSSQNRSPSKQRVSQ